MIVRFQVDEKLPLPARNAVHVVQTALKVSRQTATKLIHDSAVTCRGRIIAQPHTKLNVGDQVEIDYVPQPAKPAVGNRWAKARSEKLQIVHDDEAIVVVNKPAGLLTVPSPKREKNTLRSQLRKWVQNQSPAQDAICVHRLDRGVSGLLVFAKTEQIAEDLRSQFSRRKPERRYAAIVQGVLQDDRRTIQSYLTTDPQTLNRFSVPEGTPGSELAITHVATKERWQGCTLVSLKLETGRRNQIRVHLAELGHPILGEPRYRASEAEHPLWPFRRLALHAESLGFDHPLEQTPLKFELSWPQEFRSLRKKLFKRNSPNSKRTR